jgi:hypothetical protein
MILDSFYITKQECVGIDKKTRVQNRETKTGLQKTDSTPISIVYLDVHLTTTPPLVTKK